MDIKDLVQQELSRLIKEAEESGDRELLCSLMEVKNDVDTYLKVDNSVDEYNARGCATPNNHQKVHKRIRESIDSPYLKLYTCKAGR